MKRLGNWSHLLVIGWLVAVSIPAAFAAAQVPSDSDADTSRPNVVMILADDQSYRDFGFMGNRLVHTPHIDRLAARSARYPHGYVPMSVCRPSLATLLTGLYPHQHGIHFNHPPPGLSEMRKMTAAEYEATRARTDPLITKVPTLPRILAAHGYACLQTGKHWEGSYRLAGFTHGMTTGRPADRLGSVTGTREQANGEWVAHGNGDIGLTIGRETMQPVLQFIDQHAEKQPFFVWYAPFLPHTPYDAADKYARIYAGRKIEPHLMPYYASIARFDETVGQLIAHLEHHQLLSDTLIVFVSDNGLRPDPQRPERQDGRSKLSQYEDGLRTPILLSWVGQTKPATHNQIVESVDVVPTILAAAGLSEAVTDRMPGRNLMVSARGQSRLRDRPAYGAIFPNDAQSLGHPAQHVRGRWIRDGRYKLIVPGPGPRPLPLQLFDLERDPWERSNLVPNPEFAADIARLRRQIERWWPAGDDSQVTKID